MASRYYVLRTAYATREAADAAAAAYLLDRAHKAPRVTVHEMPPGTWRVEVNTDWVGVGHLPTQAGPEIPFVDLSIDGSLVNSETKVAPETE